MNAAAMRVGRLNFADRWRWYPDQVTKRGHRVLARTVERSTDKRAPGSCVEQGRAHRQMRAAARVLSGVLVELPALSDHQQPGKALCLGIACR